MDRSSPFSVFAAEWALYLEQYGHRVKQRPSIPGVLVSQKGHRNRYRWLLLQAHHPMRKLTPIEHAHIQEQLRLGQNAGELVYLVVRFELSIAKVIVLPAARAARSPRIRADKGGIRWD